MSQTRRFIFDAGSNYLRMVATILGTIFLTRAMVLRWSGDDFGRWSLVTTVMSFALLLDLGLSNVVLKAAGTGKGQTVGNILSSALIALLVLGSSACVLLSCAAHWLLSGMGTTFGFVIIALSLRSTVASLPWTVCRSALYARGKMSATNLMQSIGILVYSAVACGALSRGASLASLATISLLFAAIDSVLLFVLFKHYLPDVSLRLSFDYAALRPLLSLGGASLLINLAGFILLKTDPIIVKTFLPFAQVGIYAVALRIAENIFLLCKQLVNALTPHAIRAGAQGDVHRTARIFGQASRYVMAVGAPIYVCILVVGKPAIRLWLSAQYEPSAAILNILLLAMILSIPQLVASNLLTFAGHHKRTATFVSSGALINVLASIVFVHLIGVTGVAYGTLLTTVVIDVAFVLPFACRAFNLSFMRFVLDLAKSIAVPAVLQAMALTALRQYSHANTLLALLLEGTLSCIVFLIAFVLIGVSRVEREGILNAVLSSASVTPALSEAR